MKRVYRLLGIPVWSVDYGDEADVEPPLTAGDNGGETRSDRIDVAPLGFVGSDGWEDKRGRG